MNPTRLYIKQRALALWETGKYLSFSELARELNANQLYSNSGKPYSVPADQGIGSTLRAVYRELEASGDIDSAHIVADRFVDRNGNHPWLKEEEG